MSENKAIVLMGDSNRNILNNNALSFLVSFINLYGPRIANKQVPTRIGTVHNSETLINHMISDYYIKEVVVGDVNISSDYFLLLGFFLQS